MACGDPCPACQAPRARPGTALWFGRRCHDTGCNPCHLAEARYFRGQSAHRATSTPPPVLVAEARPRNGATTHTIELSRTANGTFRRAGNQLCRAPHRHRDPRRHQMGRGISWAPPQKTRPAFLTNAAAALRWWKRFQSFGISVTGVFHVTIFHLVAASILSWFRCAVADRPSPRPRPRPRFRTQALTAHHSPCTSGSFSPLTSGESPPRFNACISSAACHAAFESRPFA